ncbi:uncharacterized protein THITE_2116320 [Thermothielavioides terrestris NRRL 8126]|jgi:hypothetical protein|uniref:Rhodopsin domain-containing protein n=1 Tax=Thermothielavioides terrestris (strain ATCC 38088 / NRRL 8126) TaxID=578455 RepID=G2R8M5_THETT|nr:uncharacterized protein THITE_2116320 [Thermothielavioides terrestris NRRL 8126]AEO67440.1 hypothetical protein THITE_2116320 [Thermothielavioides terrestris NRRL 8126]
MGPKFILDHADYGPQLNVLVWLLLSLSGLFLFTRLYLKHSQKRGLWWDDWILLASWLALAAEAGLTAYLVSLGYGRQLIPLKNLARFGLPSNVLSTLLIISNLWGKTSFGMTLLRIPVRRMRVCVWFILTSLTAIFTLSVVLVWVDCLPFRTPKACVPIDVSTRYNVFSCGKGVSQCGLAARGKGWLTPRSRQYIRLWWMWRSPSSLGNTCWVCR